MAGHSPARNRSTVTGSNLAVGMAGAVPGWNPLCEARPKSAAYWKAPISASHSQIVQGLRADQHGG